MIETELGNLRRSHYSDEINPSMDGTQVIIMGWVLTIRGHGNICFATIRDKNGDISVVAKKGDCPDEIREKNIFTKSTFFNCCYWKSKIF